MRKIAQEPPPPRMLFEPRAGMIAEQFASDPSFREMWGSLNPYTRFLMTRSTPPWLDPQYHYTSQLYSEMSPVAKSYLRYIVGGNRDGLGLRRPGGRLAYGKPGRPSYLRTLSRLT